MSKNQDPFMQWKRRQQKKARYATRIRKRLLTMLLSTLVVAISLLIGFYPEHVFGIVGIDPVAGSLKVLSIGMVLICTMGIMIAVTQLAQGLDARYSLNTMNQKPIVDARDAYEWKGEAERYHPAEQVPSEQKELATGKTQRSTEETSDE